MKTFTGSNLGRMLSAGHFVVTAEVGPPRGPDPAEVKKKAGILRGVADAYNVTDNQTAVVRMSSIAASKILLQEGLEPVMQMVCRDRNRIAIQSDLLGAWALGMRNVLCLSGDHQSAGAGGKLHGHPGAKNVYDIDSIQLIRVVKNLRDGAVQEGGDSISPAATFLIGAAWTPLGPPEKFRTIRLAKKINAGADFIQTQAVYDVERFRRYMNEVCERGLDQKVHILAGIIPIRSLGMARYMRDYVSGVTIPEDIITRLEQAPSAKEEGVRIVLEIMEQIKEIPGVHGVHIMAVGWEEIVKEIVEKAGLIPRPVL